MNSSTVNLIQVMLLVICFTGIFSYAVYSYENIKHKIQENITKDTLILWFQCVKKILPEDYISFEKYGIWRYIEQFKIKMMF